MSQRAVTEVGKSAERKKKKGCLKRRKTQWHLLKATKKRTVNTEGGMVWVGGLDTAQAGIQSWYAKSMWTVNGNVQ